MKHPKQKPEPVLLIDGAAGIYVPRNFYERFDFGSWGLDVSDYADLSMPENEHYWDAWDELLSKACHVDADGVEWYLSQDDDLFAIPKDYESEDI